MDHFTEKYCKNSPLCMNYSEVLMFTFMVQSVYTKQTLSGVPLIYRFVYNDGVFSHKIQISLPT